MTKLYINTQEIKKNIFSSLSIADTQLRIAVNYCIYMVIPDTYVNLNYLKGCESRLKCIKSELNDLTQNLNILISNMEKLDEKICIDILNHNCTEIKARNELIN